MQVQLFEADDDLKAMRAKLRVNREMSLAQLGIPKPELTNLRIKDELKTTTIEEYFSQEHRDTCLRIIQAVRAYKQRLTGDIYTDFYSFGEPSKEDYQTKNWHDFTMNLMLKERLRELVNEKKVEQIQQKYFQSEVFLNMKSKLDTVDWHFAAEKTDMQKLRFAQGVLRKRLRKRMNLKEEGLREKRLAMQNGFHTSRSFLRKLAFPQTLPDGRKAWRRVHAVLEVKFSADGKEMIIEGRDLNRRGGWRHSIQPITLLTTNQFVEMAEQNWEFFFAQIRISPSA